LVRKNRAVPQNRQVLRSFQPTPLPVRKACEIFGSSRIVAATRSPTAPMNTGLSSSANTIACSGLIENLAELESYSTYPAAACAVSHSRTYRSVVEVALASSAEVIGRPRAKAW